MEFGELGFLPCPQDPVTPPAPEKPTATQRAPRRGSLLARAGLSPSLDAGKEPVFEVACPFSCLASELASSRCRSGALRLSGSDRTSSRSRSRLSLRWRRRGLLFCHRSNGVTARDLRFAPCLGQSPVWNQPYNACRCPLGTRRTGVGPVLENSHPEFRARNPRRPNAWCWRRSAFARCGGSVLSKERSRTTRHRRLTSC